MKTVEAILFRIAYVSFGNDGESGEQQRNLEKNERKNRKEEIKIAIMLDLILFQLKLSQDAQIGKFY